MGTIPSQLAKVIIFGNPNNYNNAVTQLQSGPFQASHTNLPPAQNNDPGQNLPGAHQSNSGAGGGSNTNTQSPTSSTNQPPSSTSEITALGSMGGFGGGGGGGMAAEEPAAENKSLEMPKKSNKALRNGLLIAAGVGLILLFASGDKKKSVLKSIL